MARSATKRRGRRPSRTLLMRRANLAPDEPALLRPILRDGEKFAAPRPERADGSRPELVFLPMRLLARRRPARGAEVQPWRPASAEVFYQPRVVVPCPPHRLRRFSGKPVEGAQIWSQIFQGESRSILFDTSYPWRCVGLLTWMPTSGPGGGACTAALIGRRLILTAAHCIPWGLLWSGATITFVPAFANGTSRLGAAFTARVNAVGFWERVTDDVCGYDMAVCRLDSPLGDSLGFFGAKGYITDWEDRPVFAAVGYPWDVAGGLQPSVETGIAVVDDDSDSYGTREIETKADSGHCPFLNGPETSFNAVLTHERPGDNGDGRRPRRCCCPG